MSGASDTGAAGNRFRRGADMAEDFLTVKLAFNRRRADAIYQEAVARIRRARKNDRPALVQRFSERIARECVRIK